VVIETGCDVLQLRTYDIVEYDLITKSMEIYVTIPRRGNVLTFVVDATDSIYSLKEKIEKREGIPADQQQLSLAHGQEFLNTQTMSDCNIKDGSLFNVGGGVIKVK
jgi:hypothetical protein